MFVLVAVVMIEAIRSWIRYAKTVKQDYRTREEIEAETNAELAKTGKLDLSKIKFDKVCKTKSNSSINIF